MCGTLSELHSCCCISATGLEPAIPVILKVCHQHLVVQLDRYPGAHKYCHSRHGKAHGLGCPGGNKLSLDMIKGQHMYRRLVDGCVFA